MKSIELFQKALVMSKERYKNNPDYFILPAIIAQLEYLFGLANGSEKDFSRLNTIIIAQMTARDIDNWDPGLAKILHLVAGEVKKMKLKVRNLR